MQYFEGKHLPKRLLMAILFAFIFAITGRVVPDNYYRFGDNTRYITIDSPVNVDRKFFKPCDKVVLTASLSSLIDVDVMVLNQLVLVKDDGIEYNLTDSLVQFYAPIRKSEPHTTSYPYPLPCNIESGRYFWKGSITYTYRDVAKTVGFISQTFNVTESGLSPDEERLIREKIESNQ